MSKYQTPLFDTNVFTSYAGAFTNRVLAKMKLSSVVLYELTATTIAEEDLSKYEAWRKQHELNKTLLTPDKVDWWETAKMIRRLRFGAKSASHGLTPKLTHAHQLQNDALIARTATAAKCYVVTTDVDDFEQFLPYLPKLEIYSTQEFFG